MDPLVSTRISIRWPPAPPTDDQAVCVIQGRSGFFLDLRITRTVEQGSGEKDCEVTWATAGWKEVLPARGEEGQEHVRARFTPVIDSRRPLASSPSTAPPSEDTSAEPDEGTFTPLPNGDVLETGSMLNPDTGLVQEYEEIWRRWPLQAGKGKGKVEVIILESRSTRGRAFLGRVGDYEIGMEDAERGFGVVRRVRREGEWETVCCNEAGLGLPAVPLEMAAWEQGSTVELGGRIWEVVEHSANLRERAST
ncbi:hypothetical protein JCM1841_005930 [Sporobolomyces salmonicolor]